MLPNVEFQTPVVIVPTEARLVADVILFCAAVPIVPYKLVTTKSVPCIFPFAVNLPKEPVEAAELLTSAEDVKGKVILILTPLSVISPDSSLPFPCAIITLLSVKAVVVFCIGTLYSEPD